MSTKMRTKECKLETSVYIESQWTSEAGPTITRCQMKDGVVMAIQPENNENVFFAGISQGSSLISRMVGVDNNSEIIELLTRAVNNRTRQRNYFRLYNNMLEGLITEDDFYKIIEENEDDYVIEESEEPSKERILHAMILSQGIKDVKNSEDLATLFSFSSETTDCKIQMIEANGGL